MLKKYMFNYNGNEAKNHEIEKAYFNDIEEEYLTEHELLSQVDGMVCIADIDDYDEGEDGPIVEAFFEDGNELNVYISELTEID